MINITLSNHEKLILQQTQKIINAIANQNYSAIETLVDDMGSWDISFLEQVIESFKQDNDLTHIDAYDVECTYSPQYVNGQKYKQEDLYPYKSGKKYGYEYHLTTNGIPNDLVLNLTFEFTSEQQIKVIFDSGLTI